jgi:hypothetical protein
MNQMGIEAPEADAVCSLQGSDGNVKRLYPRQANERPLQGKQLQSGIGASQNQGDRISDWRPRTGEERSSTAPA